MPDLYALMRAANTTRCELLRILADISDGLLDDRLLVGVIVNGEIAQNAQPVGHESRILT